MLKNINSKPLIKCYYFNAKPNFGDLLNINLFKMFGVEIESVKIKNSQIIAIGSLLQTIFSKKLSLKNILRLNFNEPLIVYGSGFIEDTPTNFYLIRKLDVRAVRGYNSLEKLKNFKNKNIKIADDVVIGDPGLLSKYFVEVSNIEKEYDLGIIPHYVDINNSLLNKINVNNSIVIDIQQEPEIFIKKVAKCKNIISSAMHGLIVADSLGIPNIRMVLSDKITGGDYKFNDYYSAFGLKSHRIINLSEQMFTDADVPNIAKYYNIQPEHVEQICQKLISKFPYSKDEDGKCVLK